MRLFFTYFGGKYRAAPLYPAPDYGVIIEPFAGSAGFSLRYPDRDVVLVERDERVAAVWRFLMSATPDDIWALPLIGEGWKSTEDLKHLPIGARHLIGFWLSKATAAPRKTPSAWALTRPDCSYWGPRVRERIALQVDGIRHWSLIEGDYSAAPDIEATWFVDPPYVRAGHQYRHGSASLDYRALGNWSRGRRGQVIVCEGPVATWLPFKPLAHVKGQRRSVAEYVWLSTAEAGESHGA